MEKQLEELNKRLLQSIGKTYPVGLAQGQMGISIYFFSMTGSFNPMPGML